MRTQLVRAIVSKDVRLVLRNRGVRVPLLAAPVVILVVLPLVLVSGMGVLSNSGAIPTAVAPIEQIPEDLQASVTGFSGSGVWAVFILEVFLAPLFLLVPLLVATVIAADSFAGERERGTLEALLHTPTTDGELFAGKLLASWLPAAAVGIAGFGVYALVANTVAWPYVGRLFFPPPSWWVLGIWVTPAIAGLGLGLMVLVSSRVSSLQAAHQIGSLLVLPVVVLVVAQVAGFVSFDTGLLLGAGAALWGLDGLLLAFGVRTFTRNRLAMRL